MRLCELAARAVLDRCRPGRGGRSGDSGRTGQARWRAHPASAQVWQTRIT